MRRLSLFAASTLLAAGPAAAHVNPVEHGSFATGFVHPLFGADHLLAMVAVGLWATVLGARALWALPLAFVAAMGLGFSAALAGVGLTMVEPMILASVLALGALVALAVRVPLGAGIATVAAMGVFHGYAHGAEMAGATAGAFLAGFVVSTAFLHSAGVAAGVSLARIGERRLTRGLGAIVTLVGSAMLLAG